MLDGVVYRSMVMEADGSDSCGAREKDLMLVDEEAAMMEEEVGFMLILAVRIALRAVRVSALDMVDMMLLFNIDKDVI